MGYITCGIKLIMCWYTYASVRSWAVDAKTIIIASGLVSQAFIYVTASLLSVHEPSVIASQATFRPSLCAHVFAGTMAGRAKNFLVVSIRIVKSTSALLTKFSTVARITDAFSIAFSGS